MAQILRMYKPDVATIARCYSTRRGQRSHYEVLDVPTSASQKEIRHAFLKLSKKMHPDVCGKGGHAEFVKINEAYSTLSKENSRRQYDFDLDHSQMPSNSPYAQYQRSDAYRTHMQWKERSSRHHSSLYSNVIFDGKNSKLLLIFLFSLGVIIQMVSFNQSMRIRDRMLERSGQYSRELEEIRKRAESRTPEEQAEFMQNLQDQYNRRMANARGDEKFST